MRFSLKKPCKTCPFLKDTTMVLAPGRMKSIAKATADDMQVFPCHKTLGHDEEGNTKTVDTSQACVGALAYGDKHYARIPVLARLALARRELRIETIEAAHKLIEEPNKWQTSR